MLSTPTAVTCLNNDDQRGQWPCTYTNFYMVYENAYSLKNIHHQSYNNVESSYIPKCIVVRIFVLRLKLNYHFSVV